MSNWIKTPFKKNGHPEEIQASKNTLEEFHLYYNNLLIGTLSLSNKTWIFLYSEDFKNQHKIAPLTEFPDSSKIYTSKHLWPFFAHRIPGTAQPKIQQIISTEKLNPNSDVELLRRFGKKSITNPFELV